LYTHTRFGRYYHGKDVQKARDEYGDGGHTVIEPTMFDSTDHLVYIYLAKRHTEHNIIFHFSSKCKKFHFSLHLDVQKPLKATLFGSVRYGNMNYDYDKLNMIISLNCN